MDLERLRASLADHYRLERELGRGGMATVFLAHDLKHERKVAIKILKPELSAILGVERFLHEIKTTANLQHPHILSLFDSGEAAGQVYYVMPFVEGESLRDRLQRERQLPIEDALRIAREIADALEYAHQHRVVHRDIKPENILLLGGHAMVADFGIALAASQSTSGERMTETGMSLGTPHYMSPEQAMGEREITGRADIYALGAVLYEMLTGEPPFNGATAQAVFARVLTEAPRPITLQRHTVPAEIEEAVLKALEKLPADRQATAAEFAATLRDVRPGARLASRATAPSRRALRPRRLVWAAGMTAALVLAFVAGAWLWHPGLPPITGFGTTTKVTWDRGIEIQPAISPDGKYVAYAGGTPRRTRIFVRAVAGGRAIVLTSATDALENDPTWSPDGTRVLFLSGGGVQSAPATGGAPRPEVPAPAGATITDAAWSPDGSSIAYVTGDSILVLTPSAAPRLVARAVDPGLCRWSPNGVFLACMTGNTISMSPGVNFGNLSPSQIVVVRVATGEVVPVTDNKSPNQSPIWSGDGGWLYFVSGRDGPRDIYAQRISGSGRPSGDAIRLTTGLGAQAISLTPDGARLSYSAFTSASNIYQVPWPARRPRTAGEATPLTTGQNTIDIFRVSPDGRSMLLSTDASGNSDLYRMPIGGGEMEQLTSTHTDNFGPALSPDGKELAFHSWRGGSRDIYVMPMDGGATQQVTRTADQEFLPIWSRDGRSILYCRYTPTGGIFVIHRDPAGRWGEPTTLRTTGAFPTYSPDGRTIAFAGDFTTGGLYTMPAAGGTATEIFVTGGKIGSVEDPEWSADGRSILFKAHDAAGGHAAVYSIPRDGGTPRILVDLDDADRPSIGPFWAASASTIYFLSEEFRSDIVVMETIRR